MIIVICQVTVDFIIQTVVSVILQIFSGLGRFYLNQSGIGCMLLIIQDFTLNKEALLQSIDWASQAVILDVSHFLLHIWLYL